MLSKIWQNTDFVSARLVVYATTAILMVVMLFADPFHYACNEPGLSCPGCGVKTGVYLLVQLDLAGAMQSHPFCLFIGVFSIFAIIDVAALVIQRVKKLHREGEDCR